MTRVALACLARAPEGFVLQVEGGRIDHAAHANDAAALVREQLDLDAALADVIAFQRRHPDTLVVVTSDHGNGNPGLNGVGDTAKAVRKLGASKASFDLMIQGLGAESSVEQVQARIAAGSGLPVTVEEAGGVLAALSGRSTAGYRGMRTVPCVLGQVLANHLAIGWTGRWHTGDWVVLNAFGPGSQAFSNLVRNDAIHGIMLEALGIG
jgi:alkaline phosphatase